MTSPALSLLDHDAEVLRQERETFDQEKRQNEIWFLIRVTMAVTIVTVFLAVMVVSTLVLYWHESYPTAVVTSVGVALASNVLGLIAAAYKMVLSSAPPMRLAPVSRRLPPSRPARNRQAGQ